MSPAEQPLPVARTGQGGPVLSIRGLNHWFGQGDTRTQVLFDNNLEIGPGELVVLSGPSGSGKTTLLALVGGLSTVQDGSVRVLGQEVSGLGPSGLLEVRRRIGFIFQSHNLCASLTATQNVLLALELQEPDPKARVDRALEVLTSLGLSHHLNRRPAQLSASQRQRVAIARALANHPRLILADEPTAALGAASRGAVVEVLREMAQQGAREQRSTILVITHDERVLGVADRIVTLNDGRIVSNVLRVDSETSYTFLKSCSPFDRLTNDTLLRIASRMEHEVFARGATIFRQNDDCDRFYLIRRGKVDIISEQDGAVLNRVVLEKGSVFGEKGLLNPEGRRAAAARAQEDLELYSMDKRAFYAALAESPSFNEDFRKLHPLLGG